MQKRLACIPGRGWAVLWASILLAALWGRQEVSAQGNWTVPSVPPVLSNSNFECADGYTPGLNPAGEAAMIPNGWTVLYRDGAPVVASTRLRYRHGVCDDSGGLPWVEKFDGYDSLIILAQDIEWSDAPGKPFDVVLYQRVPATTGGVYSLSGWLLSICGNNHEPFDCPDGNYIAKSIGLDPRGGTDPDAPGIVWVENRVNLVDENNKPTGWQNMYTAVRALSSTVTVYVRMTSPYQWHGNLGFVDAFSLVRGPLSDLSPMPKEVDGSQVEIAWVGQQSPDVVQMAGSTHQLLFDVQARPGKQGEWRDVVSGVVGAGSTTFTAQCANTTYQFRVRARAEQPPAPPEGMRPNHRYPGVWSTPVEVHFAGEATPEPVTGPHVPDGPIRVFVPHIAKQGSGC